MSDLLQQAYDPEQFREQGHRLVDSLADYLQRIRDETSQEKVLNWASPEDLYERWTADLEAAPLPELGQFFSTLLDETIHMHHPRYMGHQTSNVAPAAALSELMGGLLDPGMGVFEQGNAGVVFERIIAKKLAAMMGWGEEAEGFLTSGGTLGNLTALLCARQVMIERDVWEHGFEGRQYAFMVSSEAHYSVARAIRVMGMGRRGIVQVPVNQRFQMRTDALNDCLRQAGNEGIRVIGVVSSSNSTATGAFDPLEEIAAFCKEKKLWLHVDGAHGGCVLFSEKYRHLLNGIRQADSFILDFHKMLMVPKLVTAVVFRQGDHSYQTFAQKASYLWESDESREWYNLGKRTLELTKSYMSIRVYALWRTYGTALFGQNVDRLFDLGKSCARLLSAQPDFGQAVEEPEANILCFRFLQKDWNEEKIEKVNAAIRERFVREGHFFIVQTRVEGKLYLRTTLMNPFTTETDFQALIEEIRKMAAHA